MFDLVPMKQVGNEYEIISKRPFIGLETIDEDLVKLSFDFAYEMAFGAGEHRSYRSGGAIRRKGGEIFANALQGKLAESFLSQVFCERGEDISSPDFTIDSLGFYDDYDLYLYGHVVSVKSTTFFGNLLLLEKKDWFIDGSGKAKYKHGKVDVDIVCLVRLKLSGDFDTVTALLKKHRLLYESTVNKSFLEDLIFPITWEADIPGYVFSEDLNLVIVENQMIPQGALLNGKTVMDADNYYVQTGQLRQLNF